MKANISLQPKTFFKQKVTLVLLGAFLFFVLLEVGLRLGGGILLSMQEYRNSQSLKQKGIYRILCLGESTTQNQYPKFLEQVLNQSNTGIRFSIIDKGRIGTNTSAILSQVESYLNEYQPDMVVTMMGCNDRWIMYYQDIPESDTWLFRHCRVYRFGRILYGHILKKIKQEDLYGLNSGRKAKLEDTGTVDEKTNLPNKGVVKLNPKNDLTYVKLGQLYKDRGKDIEAEQALLKKAKNLNAKNDNACLELGLLYRYHGKGPQAEDAFEKAIGLNPKNYNAYIGLGWLYRNQGKFFQAEDAFKKAIALNPKNEEAYCGLGWSYRDQEKSSQAEDSFNKAIEMNPKNDDAYLGLGWFYLDHGKFPQAENAFKKAMESDPKNDDAYFGLGRFYQEQSKFFQAENLLKKAIELNPKNDRAYGALLTIYERAGKPELAKEYAKKANGLKLWQYNPVAVNNYRKLKEILDKRKIRLVCAQYPMRNVGSLKKIFEKDKGVIFVDNEGVFKEVLKKSNYKEYFRDMFGGDFGHCTEKGNQLLAQNIADVILKEVFNK